MGSWVAGIPVQLRQQVADMSIPKKIRDALKARASIDDYPCCEICGRAGANNAHHRRNQSQQGGDVLSNLILCCGSGVTGCHGRITHEPEWAESLGYTIKGTQADPAEVEVVLRYGRVCLDDIGGFHLLEAA